MLFVYISHVVSTPLLVLKEKTMVCNTNEGQIAVQEIPFKNLKSLKDEIVRFLSEEKKDAVIYVSDVSLPHHEDIKKAEGSSLPESVKCKLCTVGGIAIRLYWKAGHCRKIKVFFCSEEQLFSFVLLPDEEYAVLSIDRAFEFLLERSLV